MSDNNTSKQGLQNSLEIIERFGGIRPMAKKLDIAVTTVQGWKKREAIPASRKELIVEIAAKYNIDIADLLIYDPEVNTEPSRSTIEPQSIKIETVKTPPQPPKVTQQQAANAQARTTQSLINGVVGGVSIAALAGVLGLLFLTGPEVKQSKEREEKIAALEAEIKEVRSQQSLIQKIVPENLNQKIGEISSQTAALKQQASQLSESVLNGSIKERLQSLEGQVSNFASLSGSQDLAGFVAKLSTMQQSLEGQEQLESAVSELWDKVGLIENNSVDQALQKNEAKPEGALSQTFGDLEKQDLKAAAMLMGLAQLRSALGRDNSSFEKDLALLQKFVGKDDQQLNQAMEALAPKAKYGVLTIGGLSRELRGLGGEIVSASLSGEDVSWQERAKARLNNVVKVEKDGNLITGTETQERVEAAQYYLDQGDVQNAIAVLEGLDGGARVTANDLIEKMRTTALAGEVENMLTGEIFKNITSFDLGALTQSLQNGVSGLDGSNLNAQSFKGLVDSFQQMIPKGELIEDPTSGYKFIDQGVKVPDFSGMNIQQ